MITIMVATMVMVMNINDEISVPEVKESVTVSLRTKLMRKETIRCDKRVAQWFLNFWSMLKETREESFPPRSSNDSLARLLSSPLSPREDISSTIAFDRELFDAFTREWSEESLCE